MLGPTFDLGNLKSTLSLENLLDSKDFKLLAALYKNARQSFRSLGRQVSLSAPAVRERLEALQRQQILSGYWLYPDPGIFNLDELLLMFRGEWTREDALTALGGHGVAFVALKFDGSMTVQTWTKSRERTLRELTNRLRTTKVEQSFTPSRQSESLPTTAWRIMDALVDEPRRPLKEICKATRLTPKTVRRHMARLVQDEFVFILPRLGPLSDSGDVLYFLSVRGEVKASELTAIIGDAILVDAPREPPIKYLFCRSVDLSEVTSKTKALGRLKGVDAVEVTLNRELLVNTKLLHSLIRKRIQGPK